MSGLRRTLHIFLKLFASRPRSILKHCVSAYFVRNWGFKDIPALFRVPESSFRVALLGSTPRVREKSFVAKSMSRCCGIYGFFLVR